MFVSGATASPRVASSSSSKPTARTVTGRGSSAAAQAIFARSCFAKLPGAGTYLTIDRWRTAADWQGFQEEHGPAYRELGRKLTPLCPENVELGNFTC